MTATLHHQMIYILQDHALDLHFPNSTRGALMVVTAKNDVLAIILILKYIPKAGLLKLVPLEWITNYEIEHLIKQTRLPLAPLNAHPILDIDSQSGDNQSIEQSMVIKIGQDQPIQPMNRSGDRSG